MYYVKQWSVINCINDDSCNNTSNMMMMMMMMMMTSSITLFKYWELSIHLCYLTMFLMLLLCLLIFIFILMVDSQEDPDTIDRMIEDGEAQYNKWRHPDPYIGKRYSGSSRKIGRAHV